MIVLTEKEQSFVDVCKTVDYTKFETWWVLNNPCTIEQVNAEYPKMLKHLRKFIYSLTNFNVVIENDYSQDTHLLSSEGRLQLNDLLKRYDHVVQVVYIIKILRYMEAIKALMDKNSVS